MGRMRTISVIVNITLFLSDEALLYHLNEGLLILCICLTGNLCSLLVGEAYAIQKIYHSSRRIRYSEGLLYPFGHALGSRINMPLQLFTKQASLHTIETPPITLIAIFQKTTRFSSDTRDSCIDRR